MLSREDATLFNTCLTDLILLNIQPYSFKYASLVAQRLKRLTLFQT